MNYLSEIKRRFQPAVAELTDDPEAMLEMIRPAQDDRFGDYQANFAMPLGKQLGRPPREVAEELVAGTDLSGLCAPPEVAGPGFINMRIDDARLAEDINGAVDDPRLGVPRTDNPRMVVVDYSSPNVAKPMHVGHIRSTVIGDSISRTLRFAGHNVITDNHIGDWGTQFGMILYGYKHFLDEQAFQQAPVAELARLYQLVNQLSNYFTLKPRIAELQDALQKRQAQLDEDEQRAGDDKKLKKKLKQLRKSIAELEDELKEARNRVAKVDESPKLSAYAAEHAEIGQQVLAETAKLHEGDEENIRLWREFMPFCRDEMQAIFTRLDIQFDRELGESFYHDRLAPVVQNMVDDGVAKESDGAICVFLDGFDAPMIIQKQDGAFLYATSDLATIDHRLREWQPDEILYVVDHRQAEHFAKLFAAAKLTSRDANYRHIKFGTVLGKDGKPFKTRDGALGLEWLLDLAVSKAYEVVCANDDARDEPAFSEEQRRDIARAIGDSAVKYADLALNRESDYRFDEEKMVANEGNTATYMQYSYARIAAILRRGQVDIESLRKTGRIELEHAAERALALEVLRLGEAIDDALADYRPNLLAGYVFGLASKLSTFYEFCHVLNAEEPTRTSRLLLVDLVGRTIRQALELLGIRIVEQM